jgi:hypothetical protein
MHVTGGKGNINPIQYAVTAAFMFCGSKIKSPRIAVVNGINEIAIRKIIFSRLNEWFDLWIKVKTQWWLLQ